jgi:hypothetical protein
MRKTNMARGRRSTLGATARRAIRPRPHVGVFFLFVFSSLLLLTIFLTHKLGAQLVLWNKLCTQLIVKGKKYTHKLFFE